MRNASSNKWTRASSGVKRLGQALGDSLFPPRCPACDRLKGPGGRDRRSFLGQLCQECQEDFSLVSRPWCSQCGQPFETDSGPDHQCERCIREKIWFDKARAAGLYSGSLKQAVRRFKYGPSPGLGRPLGELLARALATHFGPSAVDLALPVPLHRLRMKKRGFNQAWLLLKDWPKTFPEGPLVDSRVMSRIKNTRTQAGLTQKERAKNIRGAFRVEQPGAVAGKRVLLVDDVLTTGSTANECAKTLAKAGAGEVLILTLARVP